MEALREGIGLRGYGQKDPKQEYKKEGFVVFGDMMNAIQKNVCEKLFHVQIQREQEAAPEIPAAQREARAQDRRVGRRQPGQAQAAAQGNQAAGDGDGDGEARPQRRAEPKVGRNDPCPCGSGKKYKKCHGSATASA